MSQAKESASVETEAVESSDRVKPPKTQPRDVTDKQAELPAEPHGSAGRGQNPLYLGVDLGTLRTSVSASNGARHTVSSCVGYCRDGVGRKRLGRQVLVGEQAIRNRLSLDVVRPLKNGVINASEPRAVPAVQELLRHAVGLCKPLVGQSICAVIGAPARASVESQKAILQAVDPLVSSVMIVSEPFAVAYGLNTLTEALVIDIGASTTDLCRMQGTMPEEADQITLLTGGDAVDERLEQEILKHHPKVRLTRNRVREMKEKYGFGNDPHQKYEVMLTEAGRPKRVDITDALRVACHSIVPEIAEAIYHLIGSLDLEFQAKLRRHVILAGGGSRLSGLPLLLENDLKELGGGNVAAVEEPAFAGSNGALKMAMEMPAGYWKALV